MDRVLGKGCVPWKDREQEETFKARCLDQWKS